MEGSPRKMHALSEQRSPSIYLNINDQLSCVCVCDAEKFAVNKKICIHCNATFHSGVSLSNHLRAYARRKRIALLEGTSRDSYLPTLLFESSTHAAFH